MAIARPLWYLLMAALWAVSELASAAPDLVLQIVERPPYLMAGADGSVRGIAVDPTVEAFNRAGISVVWEKVPALRQLIRIQRNDEKVCSVGWYKTPERERFAKYSDPVSQDSPWAAFANPQFELSADASIQSILSNPRTTVLLKSGYVYGAYLDQLIADMKAKRQTTSGDMPQLFKMIAAGRAQISFAPLEEIQYYLDSHWVNSSEIKVIKFKEMPMGYKRYLMCSKLVDNEFIERFNLALSKRDYR